MRADKFELTRIFKRVNVWSLKFLAVIGGMMSGYSQPFISGLVNMPVFVFSISSSTYHKSNLAETSNFCRFTKSLVFWVYLLYLIGTFVGLALAKRLRGLNLVIGPVLVVVGAAVCANIPRIALYGVMYFMIGLGVGIIREVIPIRLLQIAPEGERVLIPRFGRHWVLSFSLACLLVLQGVMIFVSRISMTTRNHLQSPSTIIAGISFLAIYAMHSIVSGRHGWTSMAYPREVERACRSWESMLKIFIQEHLLKMTAEHRTQMALKRGRSVLPEEEYRFKVVR
nr:sugar transport protein 13 [Ipomoea batatas]